MYGVQRRRNVLVCRVRGLSNVRIFYLPPTSVIMKLTHCKVKLSGICFAENSDLRISKVSLKDTSFPIVSTVYIPFYLGNKVNQNVTVEACYMYLWQDPVTLSSEKFLIHPTHPSLVSCLLNSDKYSLIGCLSCCVVHLLGE